MDTLPYNVLVTQIRELCQQKKTGLLLITDTNHHNICVILQQGHIVHLTFDEDYQDQAAIPLIHQIKAGQLQFIEKTIKEIKIIIQEKSFLEEPDIENNPLFNNWLYSIHSTSISSEFYLAVGQIKQDLAIHIGPFAVFVCEEYLEKNGEPATFQEIMRMIEAVALEIEDPNTEQLFKTKLKNALIRKGLI